MLVLVSDLHLTDESTSRNVNPEAFKLFGSEVAATARKRGAKETQVVLLGDIMDFVRSDYWLRDGVPPDERPWGGELDHRTGMNSNSSGIERQFLTILQNILRSPAAQQLITTLAEMERTCPAFTVRYVIGNHDRVLWNFPVLQAEIQRAIPQISSFTAAVESEEYEVVARHGHEWDLNCHGWEFRNKVLLPNESVGRFSAEAYEVMAIGEAITAELMGGLIYHATQLAVPQRVLEQLKDVNNLRPMLHVFEWLDWIGAPQKREDQRRLYQAMRNALDGLLSTTLAKLWDRMRTDILLSADLIDRLQQARRLMLGPDFGSFRGRVVGLQRLERMLPFLFKEEDVLWEGARSEEVFRRPPPRSAIQRIVYGHTHRAGHHYFHGNQDGTVQMYINTGTYLPLITEAEDGQSFASSIQMAYVYLYRPDEDMDTKQPGTTSMDVWTGIRRKVYLEHKSTSVANSPQPIAYLPSDHPLIRGGSMATKKRSSRKSTRRKYGKAAGKTVESAMRRRKRGTLRSGKGGRGGKVKSREQAIAIGLSEARKKGAKVPPPKKGARRKSARRKSASRKRSR